MILLKILKRYKNYQLIKYKMFKNLKEYYSFRTTSLLYILDNTKHMNIHKCKKMDSFKFDGKQYCINDFVNTIDTWAIPHNEMGISPNIPIYSGDVPSGFNKKLYEIRGS